MYKFLWLIGLLATSGSLLSGCGSDASCDSTTYLANGVCYPKRDAGHEPDAAVDAGAGLTDDGGNPEPTFGTICHDGTNFSDCQGAVVDVCLISPGQSAGFCSAVGCDGTPSLCPAGWGCYDLSTIQAGAPWACVKF